MYSTKIYLKKLKLFKDCRIVGRFRLRVLNADLWLTLVGLPEIKAKTWWWVSGVVLCFCFVYTNFARKGSFDTDDTVH